MWIREYVKRWLAAIMAVQFTTFSFSNFFRFQYMIKISTELLCCHFKVWNTRKTNYALLILSYSTAATHYRHNELYCKCTLFKYSSCSIIISFRCFGGNWAFAHLGNWMSEEASEGLRVWVRERERLDRIKLLIASI